jgi:hypothetical protein
LRSANYFVYTAYLILKNYIFLKVAEAASAHPQKPRGLKFLTETLRPNGLKFSSENLKGGYLVWKAYNL